MMQIPSSNQSHSSRRSAASSTASIARWFDGLLDKACCAPGYSAGDEIDDHSIAYTASNDENYNQLFQAADEYIPWLSTAHIAQQEDLFPIDERSGKRTSGRTVRIAEEAPLSPGSVATETTAMTCSTTSSRTTTALGNGGQNTNHHNSRHTKHKNKSRHYAPKMSEISKIKTHSRSHSTGNMMSPEDEWAQYQHDEGHKQRKLQKIIRPKEVEIPGDWQHDAGFRRIWSDSAPKLPFQTVQLSHGHGY